MKNWTMPYYFTLYVYQKFDMHNWNFFCLENNVLSDIQVYMESNALL